MANAVIAAGIARVVFAGAKTVLSGALTICRLIVFVSYLAQLYAPINTMTQSWGLIARARAGARRSVRGVRYRARSRDGAHRFPAEGRRAPSPGAAPPSATCPASRC
jgi:ATP-binding cassette subfamily B protein/subfamily B ATP-binding cassette protein MsbA